MRFLMIILRGYLQPVARLALTGDVSGNLIRPRRHAQPPFTMFVTSYITKGGLSDAIKGARPVCPREGDLEKSVAVRFWHQTVHGT